MRRLTCIAWILAGACALPWPSSAQTIYKVQMPDGSILFTDSPPPDAKVLEERGAKVTPPRPATTPAARPVQTPINPAAAPSRGGQSALDLANAEVAAAERELTVARRKLELGREPLPGERLGLKGGGTRLSPQYEERVKALEQEVALAESRLRRAHEARNAAR